jgi:hypothetical protein
MAAQRDILARWLIRLPASLSTITGAFSARKRDVNTGLSAPAARIAIFTTGKQREHRRITTPAQNHLGDAFESVVTATKQGAPDEQIDSAMG